MGDQRCHHAEGGGVDEVHKAHCGVQRNGKGALGALGVVLVQRLAGAGLSGDALGHDLSRAHRVRDAFTGGGVGQAGGLSDPQGAGRGDGADLVCIDDGVAPVLADLLCPFEAVAEVALQDLLQQLLGVGGVFGVVADADVDAGVGLGEKPAVPGLYALVEEHL